MTKIASVEQQENESQKEYMSRIRDLLIEERSFPKSSDPFGPIDYIASIILAHQAIEEGHSVQKWGHVSDPVKDKFRSLATQTVASWAVDQIMAARTR